MNPQNSAENSTAFVFRLCGKGFTISEAERWAGEIRFCAARLERSSLGNIGMHTVSVDSRHSLITLVGDLS